MPYSLSARILPFVLILCFPYLTQAERLPLKTYTVADGLAHNGINKIVRDSRGFLWFCTVDGLSRFDGYAFTNYGTGQGLPHANVTDLLETHSGEYWIATYGGIVRFNPKGTAVNRVVYVGEASASATMFSVIVPEGQDRRASIKPMSSLSAGDWNSSVACVRSPTRGRRTGRLISVSSPKKSPQSSRC